MRRVTILAVVALIVSATLAPAALYAADSTPAATPAPPSPPTQPATGPGGADYVYDTVIATAYREDGSAFGQRTGEAIPHFWLFEPADPRADAPPPDAPLPVVIFMPGCCDFHRWATARPDYTRSWIDHLVRRGAVAIYPMGADYIFGIEAISRTKTAVADALTEIRSGEHHAIDLSRVAVVGLGAGGEHAIDLVAAPPDGVPTPTALLLVAPFFPLFPGPALDDMGFRTTEAIHAIPATTRMVLVGAEEIPKDLDDLDEVWLEVARASRIPVHQRTYVMLRSDDHGTPLLVADDSTGRTDGRDLPKAYVDALDWYGTWKFLDALMSCSFDGEWCEYAFGNTPEQRYMGTWSDGVPVNEAIVITDPAPTNATPAS